MDNSAKNRRDGIKISEEAQQEEEKNSNFKPKSTCFSYYNEKKNDNSLNLVRVKWPIMDQKSVIFDD